ncbi:uncharacterized protein LOC141620634 [Silene latifolia]|uniref:uncharacterized protein LOC141620634 n=1 Tax=Silene latifolia TaxID=37657 RepID=UPI003D770B9F
MVLSKITSKIGKPLYADNATTSKEKLFFARVMVEVDVSQDLPECVVLNVPYLGQISQKIIYEWLPYYCKWCGKLGHTSRTCKKNRGSEVSNKASQQVQTHPVVVPVMASSSHISPTTEPGGTLGSACGKDVTEKRQVDSGCIKQGQRSFITVLSSSKQKPKMHSERPVEIFVPPSKDSSSQTVISNSFQVLANDISLHEDVLILAPDQSELGGTSDQMLNVVLDFLRTKNLDILAILETRVKAVNASKIAKKFSTWKLICNYEKHYNGRIWFLYNPITISISHVMVEAQMISCVAHHHASNQDLQVSLVYGFNAAKDRERLWSALRATRTTLPWIVRGGFNIVRSPEEKLSPNPSVLQDMLDFNSCLFSCCLDDLNNTGINLTWTNKQDLQSRVWSKLDRALVNLAWLSQFPSSHAVFKEAGLSDHSPVIVYVSDYTKIHKRFNFINSWISHPAYEETVNKAWYTHKQGSPIFCLFDKLRNVKHALTQLHKNGFTSISAKMKDAKDALKAFRANLSLDPFSAHLITEEKVLLSTYSNLKEAQMQILRQRAKIKHIQDADSCSKYFFAKIAERKHQQIIGAIKDSQGTKTIVLPLSVAMLSSDVMSPADKALLIKDITDQEIKEAVFGIDSNSSLGIDGFSSGFFKSLWHIIGKDYL